MPDALTDKDVFCKCGELFGTVVCRCGEPTIKLSDGKRAKVFHGWCKCGLELHWTQADYFYNNMLDNLDSRTKN
jgi:hypothetical protein